MPARPDGSVLPPASFPFPSFRAGQGEALERAREAFAEGKRFVVVEAPTGAGKSAIAVALAREAKSAYVLTNQKILQDQYVTDFPDLAVMKGRANYDCLVAPNHAAAALHSRQALPACDECPTSRLRTSHGGQRHHPQLRVLPGRTQLRGRLPQRDLLVLDEAHNVEAP